MTFDEIYFQSLVKYLLELVIFEHFCVFILKEVNHLNIFTSVPVLISFISLCCIVVVVF